MQTESVIAVIESVADPALAEDWDQSGVQVAATREQIHRLAVALDPTPGIIEQAIGWQADFLLTHHPLSLSPSLPSRLDDYHQSLRLLLGGDTWLYSAHTSLDVRTDGPVSWLAHSLGLTDIFPVVELTRGPSTDNSQPRTGYGVQGKCPSPLSWSQFNWRLSQVTGLGCWRRTGEPPEKVTQIAYCPGSGMSLARTAFDNGAEVFLSGDLKYHTAQEIEARGPSLDVGHFVLEEHMMRAWTVELQETLADHNIDVAFFQGHDPIACDINL